MLTQWEDAENTYLFSEVCRQCGIVSAYADEVNKTISRRREERLLPRVNRILENWIDYCNINKFKINDNKMGMLRSTS